MTAKAVLHLELEIRTDLSRPAERTAQKLHLFEAPGGLLTSTNVTGSQWDAPFGWAPLQIITVVSLRRNGYEAVHLGLLRDFD